MSLYLSNLQNNFIEIVENADLDEWEHRSIICDQFETFIDILKESMLDGEYSMSPDHYRLDEELWKKCKILSKQGFVIGGSTILNLYGLLYRPVGDLDVWISDKMKIDTKKRYLSMDVEKDKSKNIYEKNRFKIKVDGIGLMDIFNYKINYYTYNGVNINTPFDALEAKIKYKREKDIEDFYHLTKNLNFN